MKLDRKVFIISLIGMVLAEALSFAAHQVPSLQTPFFVGFAVVAFVLTAWRLEYGLLLLIADQCLGSQGGRLFGVTIQGFAISARMALFAITMSVWALRTMVGQYNVVLRDRSRILALWAWLGLAWVLGMGRALYLHTPIKDVIMDANAYIYALLILPVVSVARRELAKPVFTVFVAGIAVLCVKSFLVFYWFSHAADNVLGTYARDFYTWIRDTRVGEITLLEGSFPRVFIQGQMWLLLGLFATLAISLGLKNKEFFKSTYPWMLGCMSALVLGGFSRSFWVSGILVTAIAIAYFLSRKQTQSLPRFIGYTGVVGVLGVIILAAVMLVPWPYPSTVGSLVAFKNRFMNTDDAALQSRWELARPLAHAIAKAPMLGSGFGKRVTYISKDLRNLVANPTGLYSTFSFEWGYGDIWLKMGLLGLAAYGFILWNLGTWTVASVQNKLATLLPLITLAIVHFFTPYLNHPLGLGVLLLYSGIVSANLNQKRWDV